MASFKEGQKLAGWFRAESEDLANAAHGQQDDAAADCSFAVLKKRLLEAIEGGRVEPFIAAQRQPLKRAALVVELASTGDIDDCLIHLSQTAGGFQGLRNLTACTAPARLE